MSHNRSCMLVSAIGMIDLESEVEPSRGRDALCAPTICNAWASEGSWSNTSAQRAFTHAQYRFEAGWYGRLSALSILKHL